MALNARYSLTKNKFLSQDEQALLWQTLQLTQNSHPRDALLIEFALRTGARASEIVGLRDKCTGITPESLGIDDGVHYVFIEGLKGSNARAMPLPEEFWIRLKRLADSKKANERLFNISLRRFQQIWQGFNPTNKSLHSLRHTLGLEAYRKTGDIHLVKSALGHRNINNTMIYLDFIHGLKELKKLL